MDLEQVIRYAIDGKALLFLGAGYSTEAINIDEKKMGDAKNVSHILCDTMGVRHNDDLSRVTNKYLKDNSSTDLISLLQRQFTCKEVNDSYRTISKINWNRVYTTNYDNVFEKACNEIGKTAIPVTLDINPRDIQKRSTIIHINGFILSLTPDKLNKEFKLTASSYNTEDFSNTKWAGLFRNDLNNAKAIIFIGTSLNYDIDLKRIINSNPTLKRKIIFIEKETDPKAVDEFEADAKDDFGEVEYIGLEKFADKINEVLSIYSGGDTSIDFDNFLFLNEEHYNYVQPKIEDTWQLIFNGYINNAILHSTNDNDEYLFEREITNEVKELVNGNRQQIIVLHSDLGNGKTCFVWKLAEMLMQEQSVFILKHVNDSLSEEIEAIDKIHGKKTIIIENYHDNWKAIEILKHYINDDYRLIMTSRSYIHDNRMVELASRLGIGIDDIKEWDLNLLTDKDLLKLIPLIDKVEKWSVFHGKSIYQKRAILIRDYDAKLCNVLIGLIESQSIQDKINDVYEELLNIPNFKSMLIAICINSIIYLNLSAYDIAEVLEIRNMSTSIKVNPSVRTLVNWDENLINIKSSIIARYILQKKVKPVDIIDTIIKLVNYANKYDLDDKNYLIAKSLISISNIGFLLDYKSDLIKEKVIELFDSLKDYELYFDNPFFWLQYAIACLDSKKYDRAKNYFDLAYSKSSNKSYEWGKPFDNFQIDTQYARYLLESKMESGTTDLVFNVFNEAHTLLISSMRSEQRSDRYVLKQIELYVPYWRKFQKQFSKSEKNNLKKAFEYMVDKIDAYEKSKKNKTEIYILNNRMYLKKCIKEILLSSE